jgi:hypothetical protein
VHSTLAGTVARGYPGRTGGQGGCRGSAGGVGGGGCSGWSGSSSILIIDTLIRSRGRAGGLSVAPPAPGSPARAAHEPSPPPLWCATCFGFGVEVGISYSRPALTAQVPQPRKCPKRGAP